MGDENSSLECPTCGKDSFEEKEYMRKHHAIAHGESIAYETSICSFCGTEFESLVYKDRKYCRERCMGRDMEGKDNPNWNANAVTEETRKKHSKNHSGENNYWYGVTGEDHPVYGLEHDEEFIERMSGETNHMYGVTGEDHPRYGVTVSDETKRKISESTEGRDSWLKDAEPEENPMYGVTGEDHPRYGVTVSDETKRKISESVSGENHGSYGKYGKDNPHWKEGTTTNYSKLYRRNRERVLERDDYECKSCGIGREDHKTKYSIDLSVHHIIPRREFMDDSDIRPPDKAAEMGNLITVCSDCHQKVEFGNKEINK